MRRDGEFWTSFDGFVASNGARVDAACAALADAIDEHFERLPAYLRKRKKARQEWAASETGLQRRATALRADLRRELIAQVPAVRGADRPTVDELGAHAPAAAMQLPTVREGIAVGKIAGSSLIAGLAGALVSLFAFQWIDSALITALVSACTAVGAALGVWITAKPLSAKARRWLFGGAAAAGIGAALLYTHGGLGALFAALKRPGVRKRGSILAGLLLFAVALRLWGRKVSVDPADAHAAREATVDTFRRELAGDVHLVALMTAFAATQAAAAGEKDALRDRWKTLQTDIAQALRHADTVDHRDVLARCAHVLGVREGAAEPLRFLWTGSPEQRQRYVPRGLVRSGSQVRVTRPPSTETLEDGEIHVVEQGEVIPDEA